MRSASYPLQIIWIFTFLCAISAVAIGQTAPNIGQTAPNVSPVASAPADEAKNISRNNTLDAAEGDNDAADIPHDSFDAQLQAQVQDALSKVPELSNDNVQVAASPQGLELTGNVGSGRERQAAVRIAQSFARGRKVLDHIVVNGRSAAPVEPPHAAHPANSQP